MSEYIIAFSSSANYIRMQTGSLPGGRGWKGGAGGGKGWSGGGKDEDRGRARTFWFA